MFSAVTIPMHTLFYPGFGHISCGKIPVRRSHDPKRDGGGDGAHVHLVARRNVVQRAVS